MPKIPFSAKAVASDETLRRNQEHSRRLGLPEVGAEPAGCALAVVGGGPSVVDCIDELRAFDGEVWAINSTFQWCRENGIEAIYYRIDPLPHQPGELDGVTRAVLADMCPPETFEALAGRDVLFAKLGPDDIKHAMTAAATAPMIAAVHGYTHLSFFGVDSSWDGPTHINKNEDRNLIWVEVDGVEYVTSPGYILQAEWIAEMARSLPNWMTVKGWGFCPALATHGDYNVTHVCRAIHEALEEQKTECFT